MVGETKQISKKAKGGFFDRCPWFFVAADLLLWMLWILLRTVAFGNLCSSGARLMPMLSDSALVALAVLASWVWRAKDIVSIVALVAPIIPLCMKRYNTAFLMFVFGVAIGIGESALANFMFYHGCDCLTVVCRQENFAERNIEERAQAAKDGKHEYVRQVVRGLDPFEWEFGTGRFKITAYGSHGLRLVDTKWRKQRHEEKEWRENCLLEGISKWREVGPWLFLITEDGRRYILDYQRAAVSRYPHSKWNPQCPMLDALFADIASKESNHRITEEAPVEWEEQK